MLLSREIPIRPEPDSQLGRMLAEIEALQLRVGAEQQTAAQHRRQLTELKTALRRSLYRPGEYDAGAIDDANAEIASLTARSEEHVKRTLQPLLSRLNGLEDVFRDEYLRFLKLRLTRDEVQRLGG